jgi:hypothetical protein
MLQYDAKRWWVTCDGSKGGTANMWMMSLRCLLLGRCCWCGAKVWVVVSGGVVGVVVVVVCQILIRVHH